MANGLHTLTQGILKRVRVAGGASQDILSTTLAELVATIFLSDSLTFTGRDDFVEQMNLDSGERSVVEGFDQLDTSLVIATTAARQKNHNGIGRSNVVAGYCSIKKQYFTRLNAVAETGHIVFMRDGRLIWIRRGNKSLRLTVSLKWLCVLRPRQLVYRNSHQLRRLSSQFINNRAESASWIFRQGLYRGKVDIWAKFNAAELGNSVRAGIPPQFFFNVRRGLAQRTRMAKCGTPSVSQTDRHFIGSKFGESPEIDVTPNVEDVWCDSR